MPIPFLAALGPIMGGLKAAGGAAITGAKGLGSFMKAHPQASKSLLQGLGGGLMKEFGDDETYNMYIQQLLASKMNQPTQQIGSNQLPGTINL